MATRNYKMNFENAKDSYMAMKFKEKFKENLIEIIDVFDFDKRHAAIGNRDEALIGYYDINNTAVLVRSDMNFKFTPERGFTDYANLRITGLEDNINQIEKEIKSKGFKLKKLK